VLGSLVFLQDRSILLISLGYKNFAYQKSLRSFFSKFEYFLFHFLPQTICSPFSYLLGSSQHVNNSTPNPHIQPPRPQPAGRNIWAEDLQEGFRNRQATAPRVPSPPPETAIESIMVSLLPLPSPTPHLSPQNLGFDRQQAVNALRATNNNVDAAANHLFSGRD
jgi:hypothetical protein